MLKLKKVAVTGGLSSGKTTVTRFLKELGSFVISADEIVHQLLTSPKIQQKIIELFGPDVEKNGNLDRKLIAKIVFNDEKLLKKLEKILHPVVLSLMEKTYEKTLKQQNISLFVAEIPLLFEGNYEGWFDATITVTAPAQDCIHRFEEQGGTEDEYFNRMKFQLPIKEKEAKAHFIITNDTDLKHLKSNVMQLFHELTQEELHPHEPRRTNPK